MTEATRRELEKLRDNTQADSLAEVVRRSLAVYEFVVDLKANGQTFFARDEDGEEREIGLLI